MPLVRQLLHRSLVSTVWMTLGRRRLILLSRMTKKKKRVVQDGENEEKEEERKKNKRKRGNINHYSLFGYHITCDSITFPSYNSHSSVFSKHLSKKWRGYEHQQRCLVITFIFDESLNVMDQLQRMYDKFMQDT